MPTDNNNHNGCRPHYFIIPAGEYIGTCRYCGEQRRFMNSTELLTAMAIIKYRGRGHAINFLASLGFEATILPYSKRILKEVL